MDRDAEDGSANFGNFGPASRQCATFLGKPGQGFGQHAGLTKRAKPQSACAKHTFVDLIQAYQDWAGGAFDRITADGFQYKQQIMAITGAPTSPPLAPSATEKEVELRRSESRAPARSKTT